MFNIDQTKQTVLTSILEEVGKMKKEPMIKNQGANNKIKDKAYCRGFNQALKQVEDVIKKELGKEW